MAAGTKSRQSIGTQLGICLVNWDTITYFFFIGNFFFSPTYSNEDKLDPAIKI
jgi:hypothetical protein